MISKALKRVAVTSVLLVSTTFAAPIWANSDIYVQASKGSFNNEAIAKLFAQRPALKHQTIYAGTPFNVMKSASEHNAYAFSAVQNTTIKGKLVQATVTAFKSYKPTSFQAYVTMPIDMCVLMNKKDVAAKTPIALIVSHPAALKQIERWKDSIQGLQEQAIPAGTAESARQVAQNELPSGTAAIGSCALASLYTNLAVVDKGVQDNQDNATSFIMMKVAKRDHKISEEVARKALLAAIKEAKQVDQLTLTK